MNLAEISDSDIICRFNGGEASVFSELIDRYYSKAYQVAYNILKQHEDTEEIVQDSFIKIHKVLPTFRGDASFKSWMTRIVANSAITRYRKNKKVSERMTSNEISFDIRSNEPSPQKNCISKELALQLRECFNLVSPAFQEVLKLRFMGALGYEEIARKLDCSVGTVKSRISRGRCELRDILTNRKIKYNMN